MAGPLPGACMAGLLLAASIGGCATPAQRAAETAVSLGLERSVVPGLGFQHVLYQRAASRPTPRLHVYLEGDGAPGRAWRSVPPDPTPNRSLVLQLVAQDPAPSLLLGRPCYHGVEICSPWHFTEGRYGEDVVESLAAALRRICDERGVREVVLIGHSGGGALALLVAERLPEVRGVVTIAGNLDVGAWTRHHGTAPLQGSLDPATRPPLAAGVVQRHLVGGLDGKVPPEVTAQALARRPEGSVWRFPTFDHHCCWAAVWPSVLADVDARLAAQTAGAQP